MHEATFCLLKSFHSSRFETLRDSSRHLKEIRMRVEIDISRISHFINKVAAWFMVRVRRKQLVYLQHPPHCPFNEIACLASTTVIAKGGKGFFLTRFDVFDSFFLSLSRFKALDVICISVAENRRIQINISPDLQPTVANSRNSMIRKPHRTARTI